MNNKSMMTCNLGQSGPRLGSYHIHWADVSPIRDKLNAHDHNKRLDEYLALRKAQDTKLNRAILNGARIVKSLI